MLDCAVKKAMPNSGQQPISHTSRNVRYVELVAATGPDGPFHSWFLVLPCTPDLIGRAATPRPLYIPPERVLVAELCMLLQLAVAAAPRREQAEIAHIEAWTVWALQLELHLDSAAAPQAERIDLGDGSAADVRPGVVEVHRDPAELGLLAGPILSAGLSLAGRGFGIPLRRPVAPNGAIPRRVRPRAAGAFAGRHVWPYMARHQYAWNAPIYIFSSRPESARSELASLF